MEILLEVGVNVIGFLPQEGSPYASHFLSKPNWLHVLWARIISPIATIALQLLANRIERIVYRFEGGELIGDDSIQLVHFP